MAERSVGWLPKQHGAWAMLVVPFAAGAMLSWQDDHLPSWVAPMFAAWMLSYFAFNAASGYLKAPAARRRQWLAAATTYAVATLAAGLLTAWETGPAVLWWLPAFMIPGAVALWLAWRRQERRLVGGLLTVLVAAAMVLVVRFPDPLAMPSDPAFVATAGVAAAMFGYFGGTVLHVKAMIRRRGLLAWRNASVGWHAAWTVAAAGLAMVAVSRSWAVFFLVTTIRAWLLPVIGDRRRLRPATLGLIELFLTTALMVVVTMSVVAHPDTPSQE